MHIQKYLPFALIYFFLNSLALPFGLTWMSLLAPLLYPWMLKERRKELLLPFILLLSPYLLVQLASLETDWKVYLVSLANLVMVYLFCQAFYTMLQKGADLERIFRWILALNFLLCLAGLLFYFTPLREVFWIRQELTKGVSDYYRFKMFTYEASYYATLFVPLFVYFFLRYLFSQNKMPSLILLPVLFLPLALSFSLGVLSSLALCFFLLFLFYPRLLLKKRIFNLGLNLSVLLVLFVFILVFFFRDNVFFTRLLNVFNGQDTSANGRTVDAYYFATRLISNDPWFGIGLGQIKIQGHDLIMGHYLYTMDFVATLPNSLAEVLAIFGWTGLIIKLGVEIFLFFYTKTWNNYYRLALFFYIFIYQFTGSFITNLAEYVIWILAFTPVFPVFDRVLSKPLFFPRWLQTSVVHKPE